MNLEDGLRCLRELALDLRWSWNHAADELWRSIDPELWARTHNPWLVLQTVSRARLAQQLGDAQVCETIDRLLAASRRLARTSAWFQQHHPDTADVRVAYFSMEYMLSEALPIYAGGLGNVAGDQLKAASDLGVPIIGIGLLYSQGYFRQVIAQDGTQHAVYPYNDPGQMPVAPLRKADGEWLRLQIRLPGHVLWLRAWQVQVGRVQLYLLDSNDFANQPDQRGITSELYGGGPELRLQQELILGIGGWRLLRALQLQPDVCHINEGHAAFAILDRARSFMEDTGQPFDVALTATRVGNVFTTHTAVPAGFDHHAPELIEQYLGDYARGSLHIPMPQLLALGRQEPQDHAEPFNTAYLAARGCGSINGVSRLHGQVSRTLFSPLYPRWPVHEVPVAHVTNGVHMPSWDCAAADELWTSACGKERWLGTLTDVEPRVREVADSTIWHCRNQARLELVRYARDRLSRQLESSGSAPEAVEVARELLNPDVLTIGFARRFATYKRPNLLLHDPERLARLLTDRRRPVQLILAGKAHPDDQPAQQLVRDWVEFVRRRDIRAHAIFLSDNDMLLTEHLVQGVDVWINTPRRPWEACGTSGMKALVNGGLNLSELDGWWAEAFEPGVGWALGDGQAHDDVSAWDEAEARQLFDVLENRVVPEFYNRDSSGVPRAWVARVRESMATLTPRFSANRAVREYVDHCYLPAAAAYRQRAAGEGGRAVPITNWLRAVNDGWTTIRFGRTSVETAGGFHRFLTEVHFGIVDASTVRVEIYADPVERGEPVRDPMERLADPTTAPGYIRFAAAVPAGRPATDFTLRVVPVFAGVYVPLEAPFVLWQR